MVERYQVIREGRAVWERLRELEARLEEAAKRCDPSQQDRMRILLAKERKRAKGIGKKADRFIDWNGWDPTATMIAKWLESASKALRRLERGVTEAEVLAPQLDLFQ